jgi:hypothetical protein
MTVYNDLFDITVFWEVEIVIICTSTTNYLAVAFFTALKSAFLVCQKSMCATIGFQHTKLYASKLQLLLVLIEP